MAAMVREIAINFSDLRFVSIECKGCHTKVSLDMANYKQTEERPRFAPRRCPTCNMAFDTSIDLLNGVQASYELLANLRSAVQFRIPATTTEDIE